MIPYGKTPEETLNFIKALAVDNASEGISITDATKPDNPLIYVNSGFENMTGYLKDEVLGRNCRFLQGDSNQSQTILRIRESLQSGVYVQEELINFRKNGQPFWNKLSITPIFQGDKLLYFIGIQEDITAKKEREELNREIANKNLILKTTLIAEQRQRSDTGAELHDNVNQLLAAAKMYIGVALKNTSGADPMLQEGSSILDSAIAEIRKLSRKLVNPDNVKPLGDSIAGLIKRVAAAAPFKITLDFDKSLDEEIPASRRIAMFRIVQEQLNNIYKYAECTGVHISVLKEGINVCMRITDNGKGFDLTADRSGIGIKNMSSRAKAEGGTFVLESASGEGTQITVQFPMLPH